MPKKFKFFKNLSHDLEIMSNSEIFVGGFSRNTTEDDLKHHFNKFGNIHQISMKNGYAFIVHYFFFLNFLFC